MRSSLWQTCATLLCALLLCAALLPAAAPTLAAGPDCAVGTDGFASIQAAIDDPGCARIAVPAGRFTERLTIERSVSISGAGAAATVVDANRAGRVVTITGGTVQISGLTLRGGEAPDLSSAIQNSGILTLNAVKITDNRPTPGRWIPLPVHVILSSGPLTILGSEISGNNKAPVAAILADFNLVEASMTIQAEAPLLIRDTAITENGSPGVSTTANATLDRVVLNRNGVGLFAQAPSRGPAPIVSIDRSSISNGTTSYENTYGIITSGRTTVTNTTISTNDVGIRTTGTLTVTSSTLANNYNGALLNATGPYGGPTDKTAVRVQNTLLFNQYRAPCIGGITSLGHNLEAFVDTQTSTTPSCALSGSGDLTRPYNDAQLGPLQDNGGPTLTHALRLGSAAIGAGADCPATDQRGVARSGGCDIGAYQRTTGATLTSVSPQRQLDRGQRLSLTVFGGPFGARSVVQVNGANRPTSVVSSGELVADVTASGLGLQTDAYTVTVGQTGDGLADSTNALTASIALAPEFPNLLLDRRGSALGTLSTVAVTGSIALVGVGAEVALYSIADPSAPVWLGGYRTDNLVQDIAVVGNRAYITLELAGLLILDIGNPAAPRKIGAAQLRGAIYGFALAGSYAYVAGGAGLSVVDVSDPTRPYVVQDGISYDSYAVSISGNRLYLSGNTTDRLVVYDISNPRKPVGLGEVSSELTTTPYDVFATSDYVYATVGKSLTILRVNPPGSVPLLSAVASVTLPDTGFMVWVSGGRAYVTQRDGSLSVIDVTNPAVPQLLGGIDTPGDSNDVRVSGTLALVADGLGGLQLFDTSNPAAIVRRGQIPVFGAEQIALGPNRAYVAASGSMSVVDTSDIAAPVRLGSIALPGNSVAIAASNTLTFVASAPTQTNGVPNPDGGLRIVDVSNPMSPQLRGTYVTTATYALAVSGNYAYLGTDRGLEVVDVSNAVNPQLVRIYRPTGVIHFTALTLAGNRLYAPYVGDGPEGGVIIDLSVPDNPVELQRFATADIASDTVVVGTTLYAIAYGYLSSFDLTQTASLLQPLNSYYVYAGIGSRTESLAVDGNTLYVTERALNQGYVTVLDISARAAPKELTTMRLSDRFRLKVVADTLYVAGGYEGLQTFQLHRERAPVSRSIGSTGGALTNLSGDVSLSVPAGAVSGTTALTYTGLLTPNVPPPVGSTVLRAFALEARDALGVPVTRFTPPLTLTVRYSEAEIANGAQLQLVYWNGRRWVPAENCVNDPAARSITCRLDHLTEFALVTPPLKLRTYLPLTRR